MSSCFSSFVALFTCRPRSKVQQHPTSESQQPSRSKEMPLSGPSTLIDSGTRTGEDTSRLVPVLTPASNEHSSSDVIELASRRGVNSKGNEYAELLSSIEPSPIPQPESSGRASLSAKNLHLGTDTKSPASDLRSFLENCAEYLQKALPYLGEESMNSTKSDNRPSIWESNVHLVGYEEEAILRARAFLKAGSNRPTSESVQHIQSLMMEDMTEISRTIIDMFTSAKTQENWTFSDDELLLTMKVIQTLIDRRLGRFLELPTLVTAIARKRRLLPSYLFLSGIRQLGRYPVNGGGFADVYRGEYRTKIVALKVLRVFEQDGIDPVAVHDDFCREAIVWRQLNHKNILPFYGVSNELFFPRFCMVSPWMENGNLTNFLKKTNPPDRLEIVAMIADGLHYLHTFTPEVIHGDLCASNILVGEDNIPRLADFGMTPVFDLHPNLLLSSPRRGGGGLRWQAPELLTAEPDLSPGGIDHVTRESDIYAFACVCLEVFTEQIPFHGLRDAMVITAVAFRDQRPPRPSDPVAIQRGLDDDVWNLMQSCWKKQPQDRPSSTSVVASLSRLREHHRAAA